MKKYVSRKYLREKWESLKWDMEKVIDVYGNKIQEDKVADELVDRCRWNIIEMVEAIKKEIEELK